jgi:superfamily II RNA helicase
MVVICADTFDEDESKYAADFANFPGLTLSPFQKWAIKAIADGQHSLVTAHTGSGKTLPAEYAILRAAKRGKRVIYTAPIKALSNTKLADLRKRYPDISFGLITGDITDNPEAQVLIMTTEVLPNTICNMRARKAETPDAPHLPLSFEMDIDNELEAVVFDEVHYINDEDRGGAWEQAILLLPPTVQLVMLSATIDRPEAFAGWVETAKQTQAAAAGIAPKKLYLSSSKTRSVPLTHHLWFTCASRGTTHPASKDIVGGLRETELVVQGPGVQFDERLYAKVAKATRCVQENRIALRRAGILDGLLRHLARTERLPAICFVFSRRQVECCAREVSFSLHGEGDAALVATIEKECRHILASRLPNHQEYLELPEYLQLLNMLKKGVAIHHAGVLPIFREMTEMLFEKRMIKVLFATETLAVGVNFSTASVVFTALSKFDGSTHRTLLPHEYTQMAGRAGRRGIDTEGHVWVCANLCGMDCLRPSACRTILCGAPPALTSKFKVGLGMVLSLGHGGEDLEQSVLGSTLLGVDLASQARAETARAAELTKEAVTAREGLKWARTPGTVLTRYLEAEGELRGARKRQRTRIQRELQELERDHRTLKTDVSAARGAAEAEARAKQCAEAAQYPTTVLPTLVSATKRLLADSGFCDADGKLTVLGQIATQVREAHPLALAVLIQEMEYCAEVTPAQLAAVLSCQCGMSVPADSGQPATAASGDPVVDRAAKRYSSLLLHFEGLEHERGLCSGEEYSYQFTLLRPVLDWCASEDAEACKQVMARTSRHGAYVSLGGFVKAMLKICNMAAELEKAAEAAGRLELKEKASGVPPLLLKYVATAQSLYV